MSTDTGIIKESIRQCIKARTYTCVAADSQSIVYQTSGKGVRPIIVPMRTYRSFFEGKYVADTMVGKAAALLLALSGARYVYGEIMSQAAVPVLKENGIAFEYGRLVEYIKNREETGMCPLEQCVAHETDPAAAWTKIENKIAELMSAAK